MCCFTSTLLSVTAHDGRGPTPDVLIQSGVARLTVTCKFLDAPKPQLSSSPSPQHHHLAAPTPPLRHAARTAASLDTLILHPLFHSPAIATAPPPLAFDLIPHRSLRETHGPDRLLARKRTTKSCDLRGDNSLPCTIAFILPLASNTSAIYTPVAPP